jgi:hypothetical protein
LIESKARTTFDCGASCLSVRPMFFWQLFWICLIIKLSGELERTALISLKKKGCTTGSLKYKVKSVKDIKCGES